MARLLKILIADDNDRMRQLLRSLCAAPADTVIECADGSAAVAAFEAHQPDWVILDLAMPVLGGFAALKEIRRRAPDARVVIVTNHDEPSYREQARHLGATDFLSKEDLLTLPHILRPPASSTPPTP
jgi:CheY-like chemotaxis protein